MNKRHYEHTLPNIRGSLSNTYEQLARLIIAETERKVHYGTERKKRIAAPSGAVILF